MTMQERAASLRAHNARFHFVFTAIAAVLCLAGTIRARAQSANLTPIYQFTNGIDGSGANVNLILGNDGNFYGMTTTKETTAPLTNTLTAPTPAMFKLTPAGSFNIVHNFGTNEDVSLVGGVDGNFYGTYLTGDTNLTETIFKITPSGTLSQIYHTQVTDVESRFSISFQANDGSLYGSTTGGGSYGAASIFKITPNGKFTVLHSFESTNNTLISPAVFKVGTNFYGTSPILVDGASSNGESVFAFSSTGAFRTVRDFTNTDYGMINGMTPGADANVYGNAVWGSNGCGKIFSLTPNGSLTTLYQFTGGADGRNPAGLSMRSSDGHFFGVTPGAYYFDTNATIFEFIPPSTLNVLYTFTNSPTGAMPAIAGVDIPTALLSQSLIIGPDGNLYGMAHTSPTNNFVFRLSLHSMLDSEVPLGNQVFWAQMADGNPFGYYSMIDFPYVCHFSMGWEYYVDPMDGSGDAYLYDFTSGHWFYTGSDLFPYLYDFSLNTWLYYYPDSKSPGGYTSNPRKFYDFWTDQVITQ